MTRRPDRRRRNAAISCGVGRDREAEITGVRRRPRPGSATVSSEHTGRKSNPAVVLAVHSRSVWANSDSDGTSTSVRSAASFSRDEQRGQGLAGPAGHDHLATVVPSQSPSPRRLSLGADEAGAVSGAAAGNANRMETRASRPRRLPGHRGAERWLASPGPRSCAWRCARSGRSSRSTAGTRTPSRPDSARKVSTSRLVIQVASSYAFAWIAHRCPSRSSATKSIPASAPHRPGHSSHSHTRRSCALIDRVVGQEPLADALELLAPPKWVRVQPAQEISERRHEQRD